MAAEVDRLYGELRARPEDNDLRARLAWAIRRMTEASLAVTVYQVRVIANERQRDLCRQAAAQILELAPWDGELRAFATGLTAELEAGDRWVWQQKPIAVTLAACTAGIGLVVVVTGGLTRSIPLVVAAAVLSSAVLAGIVLGFRRQAWRQTAQAAAPVLESTGI
ncbi:hypothetical protein HPO96_17885 [Kribbella sandramycini]|uniref:Uncharacterized protein n=1 Tax=Kribbella sandramycini TaxID=60450 RepID=A0A7Y4L0N7_9ACTN|nr:hypothetical protein [Kribbella sandramycini]NOL42119.1 hypothetical protein [Kribbella sandramycini]